MTAASQSKSTQFDAPRLIKTHQEGVWRYLRALGCEASLADDLTQETFLIALERPFEVVNDAATSAYLRRVAHNLYVSHLRREGRVTLVAQVGELAIQWERWAPHDNGEELLAALRECFQALTERAQLALTLRFRDGAARAKIAAALEITEHGAKNLMQRAKQQLRDCIEGKLT